MGMQKTLASLVLALSVGCAIGKSMNKTPTRSRALLPYASCVEFARELPGYQVRITEVTLDPFGMNAQYHVLQAVAKSQDRVPSVIETVTRNGRPMHYFMQEHQNGCKAGVRLEDGLPVAYTSCEDRKQGRVNPEGYMTDVEHVVKQVITPQMRNFGVMVSGRQIALVQGELLVAQMKGEGFISCQQER